MHIPGMRKNTVSNEIVPGLYIKPQPNSPNLQAYCRLKRQTFRRSMGTHDPKEAARRALEWFHELKKDATHGRSSKRVTWVDLISAYVATLPVGAKHDYHKATIARHLAPFFGSGEDIRTINAGRISDYFVFRNTNSKAPPLPQTINRENIVLRQILKFAHTKGWLVSLPQVPTVSDRLTKRRRRHFTDTEYRLLREVALRRIRAPEAAWLSPGNRAHRRLLYDVIQLLANSGLRVDEMKTVTWRNVLWAAGDLLLEAAGKKRSTRRLILRQPAVRALLRIALRRKRWLAVNGGEDVGLDPAEHVIALPDGTRVSDLKTSFSSLLAACGFHYATVKNRHALTSLRHTYATQALTRKSGSRPPLHVLAKQMGTSEKMIHAHYGHDAIEDYRDELRGSARQRS
jgi:integrase